ncbi:MAG TPA: nucleotidyltransferase domain-containing protein, partial [Actinomycetes bacterium]|nr:nucleotidyltransferase domain-containing protein [Actinomycetes bacterium]
DDAPLWLAGRIALHGRLLFDDAPPERVAWQADTRLIYLDELPQILESQQEWLRAVSGGR